MQADELITDPQELIQLLELDEISASDLLPAISLFPLRVPKAFAARIEKGNPHDPLLQQILPIHAELNQDDAYSIDPLNEKNVNPVPGLLHKYTGRVLIILSGACAIHCRYCFRRHFPYDENSPGSLGFEKILEYISRHQEISEVILSGGDPLMLNNKTLAKYISNLEKIPHVTILRFHTRIPVVLPSRIDDGLLEILTKSRFIVTCVLHVNHPNELDESVKRVTHQLKSRGVTLLNQAVLLKNINDNAETLIELSYKLYQCGVLPYYLHLFDKVLGAQHFDVPLAEAIRLHEKVGNKLPGYLVPKLVQEQPGATSKTVIS